MATRCGEREAILGSFVFYSPPRLHSARGRSPLLPVRLRPCRHKLWNVRRAQLHCLTCGQEAWLEGFTVSEFDPAKLLAAAVIDQARKHRKRPPDEVKRIAEQRTGRSR
jgi:hypothetical protein